MKLQDNSIRLIVKCTGGTLIPLSHCIDFHFQKEYYTPFTTLSGTFITSKKIENVIDVTLMVNNSLIHKGIIDSFTFKETNSFSTISFTSRGYSSMLSQNEITPGLVTAVSLNNIMTRFFPIPNVTYEDISVTSNYIFIKDHATIWDGICNLCLKQRSIYPYIYGPNKIMFSKPTAPKNLTFTKKSGKIISFENSCEYGKILSDIHMRDANGEYNVYNKTDTDAANCGIVRHKHILLDRQWLDDPQKGLGFKFNFSMRGFKSESITYLGYYGEDINDLVSFNGIIERRISRLDLKGNSKGIITKLTCYFDRYCNL